MDSRQDLLGYSHRSRAGRSACSYVWRIVLGNCALGKWRNLVGKKLGREGSQMTRKEQLKDIRSLASQCQQRARCTNSLFLCVLPGNGHNSFASSDSARSQTLQTCRKSGCESLRAAPDVARAGKMTMTSPLHVIFHGTKESSF